MHLQSKGFVRANTRLPQPKLHLQPSEGMRQVNIVMFDDLWRKIDHAIQTELTEDELAEIPKHEMEVVVMARFIDPVAERAQIKYLEEKEKRRDGIST